jgi:mannose-1-phosphate guanylyltransferase
MKAFLLAAGLGTRLRPITDYVPKCMVEIDGQPLLDIWLGALAKAGVQEVLVNTHHLAAQVEAHVARRSTPPVVRLSHEPVLLGSAGTLLAPTGIRGGRDMCSPAVNTTSPTFDLRSAHHALIARPADDRHAVCLPCTPDPPSAASWNWPRWLRRL